MWSKPPRARRRSEAAQPGTPQAPRSTEPPQRPPGWPKGRAEPKTRPPPRSTPGRAPEAPLSKLRANAEPKSPRAETRPRKQRRPTSPVEQSARHSRPLDPAKARGLGAQTGPLLHHPRPSEGTRSRRLGEGTCKTLTVSQQHVKRRKEDSTKLTRHRRTAQRSHHPPRVHLWSTPALVRDPLPEHASRAAPPPRAESPPEPASPWDRRCWYPRTRRLRSRPRPQGPSPRHVVLPPPLGDRCRHRHHRPRDRPRGLRPDDPRRHYRHSSSGPSTRTGRKAACPMCRGKPSHPYPPAVASPGSWRSSWLSPCCTGLS
jgi:hypothetical protein